MQIFHDLNYINKTEYQSLKLFHKPMVLIFNIFLSILKQF